MRIGIITPAYNVAPYIGFAINSVLAQTHRDWTMTIVDDGSTDNTSAIAGGFRDPRLRLIGRNNAGVSTARNQGVAATDADAVLFLDADDWLSQDALSALITALEASPSAVASVGPYRRVSLSGIGFGRIRRPVSGDLLETLLVRNLFINGGQLLIRQSKLRAAGRFLADLRYGEDWEFWIRLACLGPFTTTRTRAPVLFARERPGGAYLSMAAQMESFVPCMDAIFSGPMPRARFSAAQLMSLRRRADAENQWIIGRELVRHGRWREGQKFLRRSVRAAPCLRRVALLVAGSLPLGRIGPFRRYSLNDTV